MSAAAGAEVDGVSLDTITELDTKIQSLEQNTSHQTLVLLEGVDDAEDVSFGQKRIVHDLGPVHTVLVSLATSLQVKVDRAIQDLMEIRSKLAHEMNATADSLENAGDIKLPSNFPTSSLSSSMTSPNSPACQAILSIHMYRNAAVTTLRAQAEILSNNQVPVKSSEAGSGSTEDFNMASDSLDTSFQHLRTWLDQLSTAARTLQQCSNDSGLPEGANPSSIRRFSLDKCQEIDNLEREAVMDKMGELSIRNCSLQSRKPVRSLGHTLDLQEIMLLAKNAKSLIYEVSLQMLKAVDSVKGEEIAATNIYHKLTRENSELLRRYCFYLKLKIQQL